MVAAALVAAGACGDQRTPTVPLAASDAPSEIQSGNGKTVKLKSLQLSANTLRIDGPAVTAAIVIGNPNVAYQSGISVRADIAQPAARRRAFDVPTQCLPGDPPGFLANGECSMSITATASNGPDGPNGVGTLVPGSAEFVVSVIQTTNGTEVELATKSVTVNLVATPSITALTLASTTLAIDGPGTTYMATLQNPAKSLQSVALQGYIVQGTTRRAAGGVQVMCGSNTGVLPPGTCTINFATSASNAGSGTGTLAPGAARFELSLFQVVNGVSTTFDTESVDITLVSSSPIISSLALDATSIVIGSGTDYTVQLQNPGFPQTDIILQGEMVQGSVVKGAGGFSIDCGSGLGNLPTITTGSCTMRFSATALADNFGGALVPGAASFVLHLYRSPAGGTQVEYDTETIAVTLLSNNPTLNSVTPAWSYVPLGSGFTEYKAVIANPGAVASDVVLQGWISQGTARRAAGGTSIVCNGGPIGLLPPGTCIMMADIVASNDPIVGGDGTLVLGPATLEVELKVGGTIVDTKSAPITLVPSTPSIVALSLESSTIQINGSTHFLSTIYNPGSTSLSNVGLQGYITQGGVEAPAGGLVVTCPVTGATGTVVPGPCNVTFTVNPKSSDGLVAGSATYVLKLSVGGVLQDTRSLPITLTGP
jgi:hypothetical protein